MQLSSTTWAVIGAAIGGTLAYYVTHSAGASKNVVLITTVLGVIVGGYAVSNADGGMTTTTAVASK